MDQPMTNNAFIKEVAIQLLPYLINCEHTITASVGDDNQDETKSTYQVKHNSRKRH